MLSAPKGKEIKNMLKTRQDLFELAKHHYITLMERVARRYVNNEQYVIVDHVGYEVTRIEEVFRPLWGIAPFLSDKEFKIQVAGEDMHVCEFITNVMLEGTSETSERRFDRHVNEDTARNFASQAVTEFAAYLVAVKFAKEELWDSLKQEERDQIANWLHKWSLHALKTSWPNNHYWYPYFCIEILKQLGYYDSSSEEHMQKAYEVLESFYVGHGWYADGVFGRFDYYEAWAHHAYPMLWILVADKNAPGYKERCEKYRRRTEMYLKLFIHFFDSDGGMVAYGRSLSYRFAAVSVFGLAALAGCDIDFGMAKNVILKNIDYFFTKSIKAEDSCFTCGYLYPSWRFAENYASDGATCCYTEGFMCLLADESHPLWTSKAKPLPVEVGDYVEECPVEGLDFLVQGENEYGGVTLFNNSIHYFQKVNSSFNDNAGYYSKFAYNSRAGFAISSRDKVSQDNMISLSTPDKSMISHRAKIYTIESSKEMQVSYQIPFVNDPETKITTWVLPLSKGYHVRIHKVNISQGNIYKIGEGGFCIGVLDDSYRFCDGILQYKNMVSKIKVVSPCETKYVCERPHTGMHNLRPLAFYPKWSTTGVLEKGEYIFASIVFFSTDKMPEEKPEVKIKDHVVEVEFGNCHKVIMV